ncbi:hypothetical protein DUNSADRAFT_1720 [Dunaliella salina]|uniref:Uncharacterized protein n=1 Tax=Dunaliella salina TaxID=3046 RepID=A0ABQ7FX53_DUNSA|nr:hypothetical protein DUNSADRAFT_1720 [Dunaliella salina]|eukprot:KAF5826930.1 hypothetical protein DUNSADRAFT_1720 [Dunaliella salina]
MPKHGKQTNERAQSDQEEFARQEAIERRMQMMLEAYEQDSGEARQSGSQNNKRRGAETKGAASYNHAVLGETKVAFERKAEDPASGWDKAMDVAYGIVSDSQKTANTMGIIAVGALAAVGVGMIAHNVWRQMTPKEQEAVPLERRPVEIQESERLRRHYTNARVYEEASAWCGIVPHLVNH